MATSSFGPWRMAQTAPSQWATPGAIEGADWLPALVPGTVAATLAAADRWHPDDAVAFDGFDFWYQAEVVGHGPSILRFEGLATIAEVYLDDAPILASDSMFLTQEVPVVLRGTHRLALCFRALTPVLAGKSGRARWRPRLVQPPALRHVRTLLLGHIPGWAPPVHAVGPWRPVSLVDPIPCRILDRTIRTHVEGEDGHVELAVRFSAPITGWVVASIGSIDFALVDTHGDGWFHGRMRVPDVELWWPHTHGTPALYPLALLVEGQSFPLGDVGFRTIDIDRDTDGKGFGLVVNGVPVFARGACWSSADLVTLPGERAAYEPLIALMVDAGMNMVRVGGTMGYEGTDFYALCAERGLMVWQDFAFSNFDYPATDAAFRDSVMLEARQFLQRMQGIASLAILCGASEVSQQAAMLGLQRSFWTNPLFEDVLPEAVAALRPDVIYVPHSPTGGAMPFVADEGISHYYGVSAHRRPLEELRRARVRFAAECLGLANVPDKAHFVLESGPTIAHPDFTERFTHDSAASWAFEGVRNHYCETLYGVDVAALRREDPERFLALSRATGAEVMEASFAEWRRTGSPTRGALVWFLRDLVPGAGWGVIDVLNEPKAAYYGLARAFRTVSVVLTDENLNGLAIHLLNETARARPVTLSLVCLREGRTPVMQASRDMTLDPRTTTLLQASDLWGGFFDTTYAFRFGEPSHDSTVARLIDRETGLLLADAFQFPLGRGNDRHDLGLTAVLSETAEGAWTLALDTSRLAQSIRIDAGDARPADNWFHLAPGAGRTIVLRARSRPSGWVEAVNGLGRVAF